MKKSLVILVLLALSFVGNAKEGATVPEKSYYFSYENDGREISFPQGLQWFQEVDLYIDGQYVDTFNIGNRFDVDITSGFGVPLGSSWELRVRRTEATQGGNQIAISVSYLDYGVATDLTDQEIRIQVGR